MPNTPLIGMEKFLTIMKPHIKVKKDKFKKLIKKKTPAKKKVKAKAKPKVVRPSPFKVGDEVWYEKGYSWIKGKIIKCIKPSASENAWSYSFDKDDSFTAHTEDKVLPASMFNLMAADAVRMKWAEFYSVLNQTFDANARILAVYRQGQKKPWAYYVIPDWDSIIKLESWTYKSYGYDSKHSAFLHIQPAAQIELKFMPISSAPQEILTYLGLHIYNRKWKREVE